MEKVFKTDKGKIALTENNSAIKTIYALQTLI